jgi:hypothetical protein
MQMRHAVAVCVAVVMSLSAAGCGRRAEGPPTEAAAAVAEPPATVVPVTTDISAPLTISVRSEDGDPLDADILVVTEDPDQPGMLTHVERPGPKTVDKGCRSDQRFQALPVIQDFRQGKPESCSAHMTFVMYSVQRTFNIRLQGQEALDSGNLLVAQERLGLAADRYALTDPAQAHNLRLQAVAAAGRMLGVTDPISVNEAPTEEFRQRLRTFQDDNQLTVTGELDSATRNAISRMKFQNGAVVVPPTAEFHQVDAPLADPRATVSGRATSTPEAAAATATRVPEPSPAASVSVEQVMVIPASAENAAIIRANRARFDRAAVIEQPAR